MIGNRKKVAVNKVCLPFRQAVLTGGIRFKFGRFISVNAEGKVKPILCSEVAGEGQKGVETRFDCIFVFCTGLDPGGPGPGWQDRAAGTIKFLYAKKTAPEGASA